MYLNGVRCSFKDFVKIIRKCKVCREMYLTKDIPEQIVYDKKTTVNTWSRLCGTSLNA